MTRLLARCVPAFVAFAAAAHAAAPAPHCTNQSPAHSVALLELYTSEGCSSCPPADRWISATEARGYGSDRLVPLSLHVDYWDQLGWKDRFANRRFDDRQRDLAVLAKSRAVYTPEVFLNLRPLRDWDSASRFQQAVRRVNATPARADIRLDVAAAATAQVLIGADFRLKPGAAAKHPSAMIALYENNLTHTVAAGENRGVTLRHDYVVREWIGPIGFVGGAAHFKKTLPIDKAWKPDNLGIAAFIEDVTSLEVLQAMASPLCSLGRGVLASR